MNNQDILSLINLFVINSTAIILICYAREMRLSTTAAAFKMGYDMLQDEEIRKAREVVLSSLRDKSLSEWTETERISAKIVCHNYDSVAIMIRNKMIKESIVADSWGDSLRRCWKILSPLVNEYRVQSTEYRVQSNSE